MEKYGYLQILLRESESSLNVQSGASYLSQESGASYLSQDFVTIFPCELRGPAWAVGSYSISQSARGTNQNIFFKTLQKIGRPAPLCIDEFRKEVHFQK